jgi:hypothetical protein
MSTAAIVGIGTTTTIAKSIVPKSNFFIFLLHFNQKVGIDNQDTFFLSLNIPDNIQPSISCLL